MAIPKPEPTPTTSDRRGTIPDLEHIKRHVPIASVWFSQRSNKGKCFVCDRFTWSNIDLVQAVLGLTTAAAVNWIADRFNVPRIGKRRPRRNGVVIPAGRVGCGSSMQELMRSGVFAKLPHATKAVLSVLIEFCDDQTAKLSYRTLQRVTGISSRRTCATRASCGEHAMRVPGLSRLSL
jgi:hypothetical protein